MIKIETKGKIGYVYKITSKSSGLNYVGRHQSEIFDKNYYGSPASQSEGGLLYEYRTLWPMKNKKGYKIPSHERFLEHFSILILEWCRSDRELHDRESFWIKKLDSRKNGLNVNSGAGYLSSFGSSYEKFCESCYETTKWTADYCYNCFNSRIRSKRFCKDHKKPTNHIGNVCISCSIIATTSVLYCDKCLKETKHRSETCQTCVNNNSLVNSTCELHGETIFMGDKCRKCISKNMHLVKFCEKCGKNTSHVGKTCHSCTSKRVDGIKECNIHGFVLHRGDSCFTCASRLTQNTSLCSVCEKETPHRGKKCMPCSAKKSFQKQFCEFCDTVKTHRKNRCMGCDNNSTHIRCHKDKHSDKCQICIKELQNA